MAITRFAVKGLKSIGNEVSVDLKGLTILAGPNASGKSSLLHGLLLLKQTLDSSFDPGALLLDGPNVQAGSFSQVLHRSSTHGGSASTISVEVSSDEKVTWRSEFAPDRGHSVSIVRQTFATPIGNFELRPDMTSDEIVAAIPKPLLKLPKQHLQEEVKSWRVARRGCNLVVEPVFDERITYFPYWTPARGIIGDLRELIHVPGLRGDPRSSYKRTATGPHFPGRFEDYAASTLFDDLEVRKFVSEAFRYLSLTWTTKSRAVRNAQLEVLVGRLRDVDRHSSRDLVSIADTGLGISQVLPVLAALAYAKDGRLVIIEQPEIHLHPAAQSALAEIMCANLITDTNLLIETHSEIILETICTIIAEGLDHSRLNFLWARRDDAGQTYVQPATINEYGEYGDFPVDFLDVRRSLFMRREESRFERVTSKGDNTDADR